MKKDTTIQPRGLLLFMLLLFVGITQVSADSISSIKGPNPITEGQSITVTIDCESADKDLIVSLQKPTSPWTKYHLKRMHCNNKGKTTVAFTVPNNIPKTRLMYLAYLTKKGKGWADKVDAKWQNHIILKTQTNFILGVNIGSTNDVTINGHIWLSENDAKKKGMQIHSTHKLSSMNTDITSVPAVEADMDTMLNSVRWASKDWNIKQPIGNGTYSVSIWIMENYISHKRKIDISVEGQTKSAIGDLEKGQWEKYTYSNVKVNDGILDIVLSGNNELHIMGFEVLGQKSTGGDIIPPVLTLKGSNPLNIKVGDIYKELGATAIDNVDGDISSNVLIGGDTVNTSTAGTYTISYDVSDNVGNETTMLTRDVIVHPVISPVVGGKPWDHGKLVVDGRMIKHADGTGFFWMGDTAWHMLLKLTKEEIGMYLDDRKLKGFNIIQAQAIQRHSNNALMLNAYNQRPFINVNLSEHNEVYWNFVDDIIDMARDKGMYIALLPVWNKTLRNTDEATRYGTFIANRYKNKKNIIWVNGGDSIPDSKHPTHTNKSIWNAIGTAIDKVDDNRHLITFHASDDKSSVDWFKEQVWLDFNMLQTGHCGSIDNANNDIRNGYKNDTRPILDGEPRYETIEECFWYSVPEARFEDTDVRQIAYMELFSGAFGYTYGHHSIWQMSKNANLNAEKGLYRTVNSWKEALNAPGAKQMKFVAKLMKSRPILNRMPDQSLISIGTGIATKGEGYAMVYLRKGGSITIHLNKISSSVNAWWYNPRNGNATRITGSFSGTQSFNANTSNDMVLVLDDAKRGFTAPGQ